MPADSLSRLSEPSITASVLEISTNTSLVFNIKEGYISDSFTAELLKHPKANLGVSIKDGLLYLGNQLVLPKTNQIWEAFCYKTDTVDYFSFLFISLCHSLINTFENILLRIACFVCTCLSYGPCADVHYV